VPCAEVRAVGLGRPFGTSPSTVVLDGERHAVETDGMDEAVVALDRALQLAVALAR
jgi:hypothetical protein